MEVIIAANLQTIQDFTAPQTCPAAATLHCNKVDGDFSIRCNTVYQMLCVPPYFEPIIEIKAVAQLETAAAKAAAQ